MNLINNRKLKIFEFWMSVLVILVHSLSNVAFMKDFVTIYIQPISVVPFFIISGFLFFRNINTMQDVLRKINVRIHTLLVPYILWNTIYYIIYVICKKNVSFRIEDLLYAMTNYVYNPTFWFLYQLMIMVAITPFLFYILKEKKNAIACFVITIIVISIGIDIPYINEDAFLYYFFGCFLAKYYYRYFYNIKQKKIFLQALVLSIGLFFIERALIKLSIYSIYLYYIGTVVTICQRLCVATWFYTGFDYICKYKSVPPYMEHTFFMYAIHHIIIRFICSVTKVFTVLHMDVTTQNVVELLVFLIFPFIIVVISYYLYILLNKKIPKVLYMLTGGR